MGANFFGVACWKAWQDLELLMDFIGVDLLSLHSKVKEHVGVLGRRLLMGAIILHLTLPQFTSV